MKIDCLFLQENIEMENIKVEIKETSNSKIIKFEAPIFFSRYSSHEYNNIDEAKNSPLAQQLFYLPFVKKVYISANFIAIERYDIVQWPDVQNEVAEQIENYINSGDPVVVEEKKEKKQAVTVYAEITPNPSVMKFVANKKLVAAPAEFASIDEAMNSPLAKELFHFPFVRSVFFDENFVSITKYEMADWNEVTMEVREYIRKHIESGKAIISEEAVQERSASSPEINMEELDEVSQEIVKILDEYVKPAVASDGGNIVFDSYNPGTKTVNVILQGACSGCPSSTITLKNGIETMLKELIGSKIEHVVAMNG